MAEKEFIEREAAIKMQCMDCGNYGFCDNDCSAVESIRRVPAADVRPVVLCRDCKHNKGARVWRFLDLDDVTADCSAGHGYPPMDWFCADGEKREGS